MPNLVEQNWDRELGFGIVSFPAGKRTQRFSMSVISKSTMVIFSMTCRTRRCVGTSTTPDCGKRSVAKSRRSVDFPQSGGPTRMITFNVHASVESRIP